MAEYSKHSIVSPQWIQFETQFPQLMDLDKYGIVQRRKIFTQIMEATRSSTFHSDACDSAVTVDEFYLEARDGYQIPVRSYIPKVGSSSASRPLLVYLHAGGFLFGDLESGDLNCRVLAVRLDISVLNVGYRLAPEWKFPHGLNDSYDAVRWAAFNAESRLAASPTTGFIVGGISAGANFAGVIAYQAREDRLSPPITGIWISVAVALMPKSYHLVSRVWRDQLLSFEQNAENPLLTKTSLSQIEDLYGAPPSDPRISFLLNPDHGNLPKRAYFQICGRDPLRDEAFLWQKLLYRFSGTKSKVHLYSGLPHAFWRFMSMPASREWLGDLVEGVGFVVGCGREKTWYERNEAAGKSTEIEGATIVVKDVVNVDITTPLTSSQFMAKWWTNFRRITP